MTIEKAEIETKLKSVRDRLAYLKSRPSGSFTDVLNRIKVNKEVADELAQMNEQFADEASQRGDGHNFSAALENIGKAQEVSRLSSEYVEGFGTDFADNLREERWGGSG